MLALADRLLELPAIAVRKPDALTDGDRSTTSVTLEEASRSRDWTP
jgi:hypothetical protein